MGLEHRFERLCLDLENSIGQGKERTLDNILNPSARLSNSLSLSLLLNLQLVNLLVEILDNLIRSLNGRLQLATLGLPSLDLDHFCSAAAELGVNLLAYLALVVASDDCIDELHAAGFSGAVFAVAVLTEAVPFPVAAGPHDLVEEAHIWLMWILVLLSMQDIGHFNQD